MRRISAEVRGVYWLLENTLTGESCPVSWQRIWRRFNVHLTVRLFGARAINYAKDSATAALKR